MEKKYTLIFHEGKRAYKVTKVVFYGDGGFCVFAPYHNAKKGLLSKMKVDYRLREQINTRIESTEYTADDQVKLSIHPDGFVQFSGVNGNIVSGRDQITGHPKGLGLMSNPLNNVIKSGPTFGATIWGVDQFSEFIEPKKNEEVIEFQESDYYYRNCTMDNWNGYALESFLFEHNYIPYIDIVDQKQLLKLFHFNFEIPGTVFIHRIIPHYPKDYIVGLLVSRVKVNFNSSSGFILGSPSQLVDKHNGITLFAMYPPDPGMVLPQQTLNYAPDKS